MRGYIAATSYIHNHRHLRRQQANGNSERKQLPDNQLEFWHCMHTVKTSSTLLPLEVAVKYNPMVEDTSSYATVRRSRTFPVHCFSSV